MKNVRLIKAEPEQAGLLHRLQCEAFMPLYERYRDDETSPAKESIDKVKAAVETSDFLIVYLDDEPVGGVRVKFVDNEEETVRSISPIFLVPSRWDKGIGTAVMEQVFERYDADKWILATIEQEDRDCHFYEKLGFVRTGSSTVVNDKMTIIGFEKKC